MGIAIAGAVIAGVGLIASIEGQAAAADHRNATRMNDWIQGEAEKGIANGREEYNAVYNEMQQAQKNREINLGAYRFQYEQSNRLKEDHSFATKQMSLGALALMGSNAATQGARGVSNSGTAKRQRLSNLMNLQENLSQAERNLTRSLADVKQKESNMKASMGSDVFIPTTTGASVRPTMEESQGVMDMLNPMSLFGG